MINKRVAFFIAISLFVAVAGYYILNSKTTSNGGSGDGGSGNKCKNGVDKDGNCIPDADLCNNVRKPIINCPDSQPIICDKKLGWRCKRKCESDTNPFPYDFKDCKSDDVKCDSLGRYYCDSDYCKNGGVLLSNANGKCSCPSSFSGDTCNCNATKCKGGAVDNSESCKCISCCSPDESLDKKCKYYGDNCEQKCELDNYVYDPVSMTCICPSGFVEDKNEHPSTCTPINCNNGTLQGNSCVCNPGWNPPNCNTPFCQNGGSWNTSTNKCDCKDGTAGDKCQYTRESLCKGNGNPVVIDGVPSCVCDKDADGKPIWDGVHCSCKISDKYTDDDCQGIKSTCEDSGWKVSYETCGKIQDFYGGKDNWIRQCTDNVLEDKGSYEKGIWAGCRDNSPNASSFYSIKTCNATPSDNDLSNCNNVDGCYIPQTGKNADKFNKICVCGQDANGNASYSCRNITNNKDCGPRPPPEFCTYDKIPQTPECIQYDGINSMWACPKSILPKDAARLFYGAKEIPIDRPDVNKRQTWWKRNPLSPEDNGNTIYPTINMDSCAKKPFDRVTYPGDFQPGWNSFESANGFVKNFGKDGEKFYYKDDPRILVYNVNANVSDNMAKITQDVNNPLPYPSEEDDLMHNKEYNTGCAIEKKEYNEDSFKRGEKQSMCAKALDGTDDAGNFIQICADKDGNVVDCKSNNSYYMTDQGYCDCYNTYRSNAQGKDGIHYVGRYCQYNDNTTCYGKGVVDYNGVCDYTLNFDKYIPVKQTDLLDNDIVVIQDMNMHYFSYYSSDNDMKTQVINNFNLKYINPLTLSSENPIIFRVNLKNNFINLSILGTNNILSTETTYSNGQPSYTIVGYIDKNSTNSSTNQNYRFTTDSNNISTIYGPDTIFSESYTRAIFSSDSVTADENSKWLFKKFIE